ncbi:MAG: V-type ATP synthase subunit I [Treponema sp.]|jgi:V/A-type H+-transporting ATPase subunit I|nr:V-type ATP synthase subunit I [Treponema sp.]
MTLRPRKMKRMELTVHKNDVDAVIEYLGRRAVMQFTTPEAAKSSSGEEGDAASKMAQRLERLRACADFLDITILPEPDDNSVPASAADEALSEEICTSIESLQQRETAIIQEKRRLIETCNEARAFSNLNAPFSELDHLSYLSLRVGRLDPREQPDLKEKLGERAVVIALDSEGERILAATSRRGRFALDSELSNHAFVPIAIPEGYKGIPSEMINGLENRLSETEEHIADIADEKQQLCAALAAELQRLASSCRLSIAIEWVKAHFSATENIFRLSGWVPGDMVATLVSDLSRLSGGRVAIRSYNPDEIPQVRNGNEKVPVSLKHSAFVKGFEGMVFSYGAPLYGTIDPTPLVAFFYTFLFGIMFGDMGQGFVLFLAGLLASKRGPLKRFIRFSTPLIAVGSASMIMGFLTGEVFTVEHLLAAPTRAITGALTGHPVDQILHILPLAEKGGSVTKLFYFFGFTVGIGVIINSLGLFINIFNCFILKKYEAALFSKTGLAGLLFFWYAIFIGLRCIFGGRFESFDVLGLAIPALFILFGPVIWRGITGKRPVLGHSFGTFAMEGLMEVWETASSYFSNTASFLRVGAFALSHGVLAYIVFRFSEEMVLSGGFTGSLSALFLMLIGNTIIIVLEGLIVAIQVLRLQYYEFFGKFFTERGVEFVPFRFKK